MNIVRRYANLKEPYRFSVFLIVFSPSILLQQHGLPHLAMIYLIALITVGLLDKLKGAQ